MTPEEARTILGLKPEDDPQTYLPDFVDARERIAEMVRRAPNDTIAVRYQEGLLEFDRALAAIREEIEKKKAAAKAAEDIRSASPVTSAATPPPLPKDYFKPPVQLAPRDLPPETPKIPAAETPKILSGGPPEIPSSTPPKALSEEAPKVQVAEPPKVLSEKAPEVPIAESPKILSEGVSKTAAMNAPKVLAGETPKVPVAEPPKVLSEEAPKIPVSEAPRILTEAVPLASAVETPKIASAEHPKALSDAPPKVPSAEAPKVLSTDAPRKDTPPDAPANSPGNPSLGASPSPQRFVMPRRLLEGVKLEAQPLLMAAVADSTPQGEAVSEDREEKAGPVSSKSSGKVESSPGKAPESAALTGEKQPKTEAKPVAAPASTPRLTEKAIPEEKDEAPVSAFVAITPKHEVTAKAGPELVQTFSSVPEPVVEGGPPEPQFASPFVAQVPEARPAVKARTPVHSFKDEESSPGRRVVPALVTIVLLGGFGGLGWWLYQEHRLRRTEHLTDLENLGAKMVEARQWEEATRAYNEMEDLHGSPEIVMKGRRSIEAGMDDEQKQFIGYWSGEALAAFEAGRWEDAEDAAHKLLERYRDQPETAALLEKIEQAKATKAIEDLKTSIREGIQHHQWDAAEANANELTRRFPGDAEASSLLKEIRADRDREMRNRARAGELFAAAKLKDQGRFDKEAMEWLRDAISLAPDNKDIAALYEKFASYTRTIRVPGDFPDLQKALQSCGDRDRIVLGEGTWPGPLVINKAISLEGAGPDKTIIEAVAKDGAAASFGPGAKGARITGLSFRQSSFDNSAVRFPAFLVRGGEVTAADCRFADASGHGVAIINGGLLSATRCTFENNGWDGVATKGKGSRLVLVECESNNNVGHGYDVWDGASASIRTSHAFQNSRNGILIDSGSTEVTLEENELRSNREFGLVVSAATGGKVSSNVCRENLLGGLVVRANAAPLALENNRAEKNAGPGLVYEKGLPASRYTTNAASANGGGKDTMANVDFSSPH